MSPKLAKKAFKLLKEEGVFAFIYRSYRFAVMRILPERTVSYNGVEVAGGRKFDFLLPESKQDDPIREKGNVKALRTHVEDGDSVVVIGGGQGVTSIVAKKQAGIKGSVTTYEPFEELCKNIQRNAEINNVKIDVRNAFIDEVGEVGELPSEIAEVKRVDPENLPECDVLEIDCEGAEIDIIESMSIRPRVVIVESHGIFGASTAEVKKILSEKGYNISNVELAESTEKVAEEKDVKSVTAIRKD